MPQGGRTYDDSLLLTLGEVCDLVSHSHDPAETLDNIVRLVQRRFHTDVCSVYFLETERGELVLAATVGLKSEGIGRVRMGINEGLTGLVAQQMAPVMVADAFRHPRFKYFPEAGEDPYKSFLGVPLVEGGALQGVLVVQTAATRTFSPAEVRMLVTVAAQVATLVADAHLLERVLLVAHEPAGPTAFPAGKTTFRGTGLSPGVGVGQAYVVDGFDEIRRTLPAKSDDPGREKERFARAMEAARAEIVQLSQQISVLVGEDHGAILQAQLMILQDRTIEHDIHLQIEQGLSAEAALLATLDKYVAAFQKLTTPFFQERMYDVKDVFYRLLWKLTARPGGGPAEGRVVLVAREASVMELFAIDLPHLAGVIVEHGGPQSHAAILARSLGIPMVGQVPEFLALLQPGRRVRVDGKTGEVALDPPDAQLEEPPVTPSTSAARDLAPLPPGVPRLEVNINLLWEVKAALHRGAGGVGLYRSEFLFLARRTLPTEEEQVTIYRKLINQLQGRPVTIRTFDLRPDKLASYSHLSSAAARPFDWRLVLESPPLQQLFLEQVRAVLRAAVEGPVRLLIPLVTRTELLEFALETVEKARVSLHREGLEFAASVPVGIMIEVAAVISLARDWANHVAFFALGTNDLTASALALDRDDPGVSGQSDPLHPGLLYMIDEVVTAAHRAKRPVSVCGEVAADLLGAAAMSALGVDSLSVPVNQFTATREALTRLGARPLADLRPRLLRQRTGAEVRELLQRHLDG